MLGFIKKQDFAIQTESNIQSRLTYNKDHSKISYYSKPEKSTDTCMNDSAGLCKSKIRKIAEFKTSTVL